MVQPSATAIKGALLFTSVDWRLGPKRVPCSFKGKNPGLYKHPSNPHSSTAHMLDSCYCFLLSPLDSLHGL